MTPLRNPLLVMKLLGLFLALSLPATAVSQDRAVLSSHPVQKGSGADSPEGSEKAAPAPTAPRAYKPSTAPPVMPGAEVVQADFGGASTFVVTNTNDSGSGSLRQAIRDANASSGADIIDFIISGTGVHTITPDSALPALTGPVLIDGTTQAGYADHPLIEIDGSHAGTGVNGLVLRGGSSTIRGLAVNRFVNNGIYDGHGIVLETLGGNTLEGNYIGTDPTGLSARPNGGSGVVIAGSSSRNKIGAPTAAGRNIFSGNSGDGLQISRGSGGRNLVQGNIIGADITGVSVLPNGGNGIFVGAQYDTIGGTAYGNGNLVSGNMLPGLALVSSARWTVVQGNYIGTTLLGDAALGNASNGIKLDSAASTTIQNNVISGNLFTGLYIYGTPATGNAILDNYIGTNHAGTASLGNSSNGIVIDNAPANAIGSPSHGNLISGNGSVGVWISGVHASGNTVRANLIGTNASGTDSIPNKNPGIFIEDAPNNTVGGAAVDSRNVISGNRGAGIYIKGANATGNTVVWSMIGTDRSASLPIPNKGSGILIDGAPNNTIGRAGSGANIISGNTQAGVTVINQGASGNRIIGNYMGVDASGAAALPNGAGVLINNAPGNTIGGSSSGEGNTISGNTYYGIGIRNPQATGNSVRGNYIGTSINGTGALGNGSQGVLLIAPQNSIGGTNQSDGNKIAHNGGAGVYDSLGGNLIRMNSLFDNGELGIDIFPRGFSKNDLLDTDGRQNFPLLDSVVIAGGGTTIHGRLQSYANGTFTLDFFLNMDYDPSHFGEGSYYFGSGTVTTDDLGIAEINVSIPVAAPTNRYITATATDATGNTSEFSQCFCLSDLDGDGLLDSWETEGWGMDVNSDGVCDLDLFAMGARPDHKDIFVEVDAMVITDPISTHSLGPHPMMLDIVRTEFSRVPNSLLGNPDGRDGIELHIVYQDDLNIPHATWYSNTWQQFFDARRRYFGTNAERSSLDSANIIDAKDRVFRYCIFADDFDNKGHSSGWSNGIISNNFMVTLGQWFNGMVAGGTESQKAGTFMHELGHSLGLRHGGGDDIQYKPNYVSIMSYTWVNHLEEWMPPGMWGLRYSTSALPDLNEAHLNEPAGLSPAPGTYRTMAIPFNDGRESVHWATLMPGIAVDWDGNLDSTSAASGDVSADLNHLYAPDPASGGETLHGFEDWSHLVYNFRNSPTFSTGAAKGVPAESDMTVQVYEMLRSLPPPKPYGRFTMDGVLDTTAVLLGSNGGIDLYAAVRGGQLYVATNSAASQGADMAIFVAVPPGAMRQSPLAKAGQVAEWLAVLVNRSPGNSRMWCDSSGAPLTCITLDTVGTMLEGVIDFQLLTGITPDSIYLAVGKYDSAGGGALLAQVPAGNGNANIDAGEFLPLSPPPIGARWRQQGDKIVPNLSGRVQAFVALSSDGNTALIGGGNAQDDYRGGAWVYKRVESQWVQEGTRLVPSDPAGSNVQQQYVALSADGNTALVGGPWDNGGSGAAWVYTCAGGVWTQQGNKLVGSGAVGNALQGRAVALSADGNTAVILGMNDNSGAGAAWVFVRANGVWSQQGGKMIAIGAAGRAGLVSVAVSGDGNTVILGGQYDNNETGAAWVYTRNGTIWTLEGSKLVGTGVVGSLAWQGSSVALSYDGNTALVGGPADDARSGWGSGNAVGATWVFGRTNGVWQQVGDKLVGFDHSNSAVTQGYSVAISSDGNTAIIGGPNDNIDGYNYAGAAWIFKRTFGAWNQYGKKLVGRNGSWLGQTPFTGQGSTVAISGDGSTALIGGIGDSLYRGAVWAFVSSDSVAFRITSISGMNLAGDATQIDWRTFSEMNRCTFTVQRKTPQDAEFADIPSGSVLGRGAPDISQAYTFTDTTVQPGTWIYRVKGVDLGGSFIYSDPVTVNVVTGIGESGMPGEFALLQNYPNPWNPATTIRFALPVRAHVSIAVYNILGQRVAELVNETRNAGYHSIVFRADGLASGIYFYRMQAEKFVTTKKFLLLK